MREQVAQHGVVAAPRIRRASLSSAGSGQASSSRHRAGDQIGLHPEDRPSQTDEQGPRPTQASRVAPRPPDEDDDEQDQAYETRSHTSVRRYAPVSMRVQYQPVGDRLRPAAIPRRSAAAARQSPTDEEEFAPSSARPRRLAMLLIVVGVLLVIMLLGWMLLSVLLSWWGRVQDDWHYGMPRVERLTIVVGHADSAAHPSLFFALNDDGRAQVIECPGGDCSHAKVYIPPILISGDQGETPVTITLKDVNRDGSPDLLIHVQDQTFVYLNDQGAFRPVTDKDHVTL